MSTCDSQRLSAYHDRELVPIERLAIEQHLCDCPTCREDLASLEALSHGLGDRRFDELRPETLKAVHEAIAAEAAEQPVWRLARSLALIAASLLIVASAWLMSLPPSGPPHKPDGMAVSAGGEIPAWEQVAMTLRADPLPEDDGGIELADARLAEWMVASLAAAPASPAGEGGADR